MPMRRTTPPLKLASLFAIVCLLNSSDLIVGRAQNEKKGASATRKVLSGVWILENQKAEYSFDTDMDLTLDITQNDPEIVVTRTYTYEGSENRQELHYFSDQRGETNPTIVEGQTVNSKTKWAGDKLVSRSSGRTEYAPTVSVKYDRVDEWKLSKDGQTLVQTTTIYNVQRSDNRPILTADGRSVLPLFSSDVTKRLFRRSH